MKVMQIDRDQFDSVFPIMDEAFPEDEIREKEDQKELFSSPYYHFYIIKRQIKTVGILAAWEFDSFRFIEHLAVDRKCRGAGIGHTLLNEYIQMDERPVVLEVELPENEISRRRIAFYQDLGFYLNGFSYCQPPLRKGQSDKTLLIMSYPAPVKPEDFEPVKREIYRNAYGRELEEACL